ncbi:hypothetical protein ATG71_1732 [Bacillus sp. es.034]|jgi:hypothetical protein|nr:hypothetical protein ATG71_1732 [Bacillus sp. es.034]
MNVEMIRKRWFRVKSLKMRIALEIFVLMFKLINIKDSEGNKCLLNCS